MKRIKAVSLFAIIVIFSVIVVSSFPFASADTGSFGYTTVGTNAVTVSSTLLRGSIYACSVACNVTSLSLYMNISSSSTVALVIYDSSFNWVGQTDQRTISSGDGWQQFNFSVPLELSASNYWLCLMSSGTCNFKAYRDSAGSNTYGYSSATWTFPTAPNPWGTMSYANYHLSIYANYTYTVSSGWNHNLNGVSGSSNVNGVPTSVATSINGVP